MSEHDQDLQPVAPAKIDDVQGAPKGAYQDVERPPSAETRKKIDKILKGKSKAADELPRLVSLLNYPDKLAFMADDFPTLGNAVSGDIVLEVGEVVELDVATVLDAALAGKQKPSKTALRKYLTTHSDNLETLSAERVKKVRGQLTGSAIDELPILADKVQVLSAGLLGWFVETTPPAIVAFTFSKNGDEDLGEKIEALTTPKKWDWVDHVHVAQAYIQLAGIAKKAPDAIKKKLETKLGPVAGPDDQREKFRQDSQRDLGTLLEGKPKLQELLDAIAAAGYLTEDQVPKALAAFKRLQPSADDLLALSRVIPNSSVTMFELLLAAKDVTRQHIEMFLFTQYGALSILSKASLLADVRKQVPDLSFRALSENTGGGDQDLLFDSEVLRKWFFETATPEDKLWFCGSGTESGRACKLMDKRDSSWKWVYELSASSNRRQLRAVALNCGHEKVTQHIRNVLLAEEGNFHQVVTTPVDPQFETKAGETGRVLDVLADGGDLMARLADLDGTKRARYGQIDTFVEQIANNLGSSDFARAAVLLDLTFSSVVAHAKSPSPALVAYLRTRPRSEEHETANDAELVERSLTHIHSDPLVVFPTLREPEQLANAIEHNKKLIKILFQYGDPSTVADLLSREPVIAATERALAKDPRLLKYVPGSSDLSKRGREGVDRLAKGAKDEDVVEELTDIKDDAHVTETHARDAANKMTNARKKGSVTAALEDLLAHGGSAQSVMALLGEFPADDLRKLLSEEAHSKLVGNLAQRVALPAHIVFPQLSIETLLSLRNSRAWLFDYDEVTVLLDLIASRTAALEKVAAQVDHGTGANALIWLNRLPQGAALTDVEVRAIDRMQPFIKNADTLRLLFKIRFGTSAPGTFDEATVRELYRTICRLPRSHLNQERIKQFVERPMAYAGRWNGEEVELSPSNKPTETKEDDETWHPTAHRMSKAQIQRLYGWNDLELTTQVKLGNVKLYGATDQYEVVKDKLDKFASTVLHEIGHSVDDILGQRTEPVFGDYGQWHSFYPADFEQWAQEQGGWDKVSTGDQKKIREAWLDAIRSNESVDRLVDEEHPALAKRYEDAGVGVVASARQKRTYDYSDPVKIGDRAFVVSHYYHQFFSLSARAMDSKPSVYSMFAPAEYFAECYVEFYKDYDGSAATRGKKGGALPQPVKNWFANNVDTLKYDPKRFEEQSDEEEAG
jgi:hypothetical protein